MSEKILESKVIKNLNCSYNHPENRDLKKEFKIRLLLTGNCTAKCSYCHNEGQKKSASLLSLSYIKGILDKLEMENCLPSEIILSGGEPTLHKNAKDIAKICKSKNIYVSMASHIGHTNLLEPILPYLDELKIHLDSFNYKDQFDGMGINLKKVINSINMAKKYPVKMIVNHPLLNVVKMKDFIYNSGNMLIDCKIIEMHGQKKYISLDDINWGDIGYFENKFGVLSNKNNHKIYLKKCGNKSNDEKTLFIGSEGIRSSINNDIIFYRNDILKLVKNISYC